MREIKFRAWYQKKMFFWNIHRKILLKFLDVPKNWIGVNIMQFTGLKDKNGKEIYVGDIIEWNNGVKLVCEYNQDNACFEFKEIYSPNSNVHDIRIYRTDTDSKIIGNIYESPKLLEDLK